MASLSARYWLFDLLPPRPDSGFRLRRPNPRINGLTAGCCSGWLSAAAAAVLSRETRAISASLQIVWTQRSAIVNMCPSGRPRLKLGADRPDVGYAAASAVRCVDGGLHTESYIRCWWWWWQCCWHWRRSLETGGWVQAIQLTGSCERATWITKMSEMNDTHAQCTQQERSSENTHKLELERVKFRHWRAYSAFQTSRSRYRKEARSSL